MSRDEPYEELDWGPRAGVGGVFRRGRGPRRARGKPFLELADGTPLTPADLLAEPPPGVAVHPARGLLRTLEARLPVLGRVEPRAWNHLLNMVAVTARYGDDDVDRLLSEISCGEDVDGFMET